MTYVLGKLTGFVVSAKLHKTVRARTSRMRMGYCCVRQTFFALAL